MKVIIEGEAKEIANLVLAVQGQLSKIKLETINPQVLFQKSNADNIVVKNG